MRNAYAWTYFVALYFVILLSIQTASATETVTVRSQIDPYSSSYHAFYVGNIIKNNNPSNISCDRGACSVKLPDGSSFNLSDKVAKQSQTSLAKKFSDIANKKGLMTLSETEKLNSYLEKNFYNANAPTWYGVCHQWSFASQDPNVLQFVRNTKGLLCDDKFLSLGEIKELFTIFYQKISESEIMGLSSDIDPKKLISDTSEKQGQEKINAIMAADAFFSNRIYSDLIGEQVDMPADRFHKLTHEVDKKPIVIDISADNEKWNHPIKTTESKIEEFSPEFLTDKNGIILSPDFFKPQEQMSAKETQTYNCYKDVYHALVNYRSEGDVVEQKKTLIEKIDQCDKNGTQIRDDQLEIELYKRADSFLRRVFFDEYAPLIKTKRISLIPGITVNQVSTTLTLGNETRFGETQDATKNEKYKYVLIKENGKVIAGYWQTKAVDRPDYLVVPKFDTSGAAKDSKSGNLFNKSFDSLMKFFSKCTDVGEILEFHSLLDMAKKSNSKLNIENQKRLEELYPKVSKYIDAKSLQKKKSP